MLDPDNAGKITVTLHYLPMTADVFSGLYIYEIVEEATPFAFVVLIGLAFSLIQRPRFSWKSTNLFLQK